MISTTFFLVFNTNLLISLVIFASYFLLKRNPRISNHLGNFNGPPALLFIGNAFQMLRPHSEICSQFRKWFDEYGTTFTFWLSNFFPYILTCDVKVIEKLMCSSRHINKGQHDYSVVQNWLGTGLLTASGKKWAHRRKMLTPSFHFKILEDFIPILNEQTSVFLQCLKSNEHENGDRFNIYPYITKCSLDIICETAMGHKINAQTSASSQEYVTAVNRICGIFIAKMFRPWLRLPVIGRLSPISRDEKRYLKVLKGFTEKVIQTRKSERLLLQAEKAVKVSTPEDEDFQPRGKTRKAFLDLLLDIAAKNKSLTDEDIREEVDTFLFEGHDTTGVNIAWTILLLAMHQEYQRLLQAELDEIFMDDPSRDITMADISKMKFLDCCVRESLRLFPSTPFITRQIDSDLCLADGRVVPKGVTAMICIYHLHRLVEHFPDPDAFKPERWFSDMGSLGSPNKRHPFSYIPFSAGPRNCIGQKFALLLVKIMLTKLFRKYSVETDQKLENVKLLPVLILRCQKGVNVTITSR